MTLHALIRDSTGQVREVASALTDYAAAKAAVEAQVGEGELLLSLRRVEEYTG